MIINWNKDTKPNIDSNKILVSLKTNYQDINEIFPINNGILNQCFGITTSNKKLFGKVLNSSKPLKHISAEINFSNILNENSIPSPNIIINKYGKSITDTSYGKIILYEFIEGNSFDYSIKKVSNSAQMQAKIHNLNLSSLENFLEQSDIVEEIPLLIQNLEKIIREGINPEGILTKSIQNLNKKEQLNISSASQPIHADYHPWNLLFNEDENINAVLDFDYLQMGKNIYDLGSSITYFIRNPPKGNFNESRAQQIFNIYLSSYNQIKKLNKEEKELIPFMMTLRSADNLSRDLSGKDNSHTLTNSNLRNLSILNWAMNLIR